MHIQIFRLFTVLFLLAGFSVSFSQTNISGFVVDKETGEGIPFANIVASSNSSEGCSSDMDGFFSLKTSSNISTLSVSYLGYQTATYTVSNRYDKDIRIELDGTGIQFDEIVVKAKKDRKIPKDTAAISLQQKVIDNKEFNRPKSFDSYEYREHTKTEIDLYKIKENFTDRKILQLVKVIFDYVDSTESGIAFLPTLLFENITDVYYQNEPLQNKEITQAEQMTGIENLSATQLLGEVFEEFDLYDNIISAGGKAFTSPFSKTGLTTYRYYLLDSMKEDGINYYRLDFSPKNKHDIAFTGYAWIEEGSYAIKSIEFKLPSKTNINFISDFYVHQGFEKVNDNWILSEELVQISANLRKKSNKGTLLLQKKMYRDSIAINHQIDPKIFEGERYIVNDNVEDQSDEWWKANRVSQLTPAEAGISTMIDSVKNTKSYKVMDWLGYTATSGHFRTGPIEFGRFYKFVSWNSIEGTRLRFGGRTNKSLSEKWRLEPYFAYGLKDKIWKYGATLRLKLPQRNRKWAAMEFTYQKDFTFLGRAFEEQLLTHDNIVNSILSSGPLDNVMLNERYSIYWEKEWMKGLFTNTTFNRVHFIPVENQIEFKEVLPNNQTKELPGFTSTEIGTNFHIGFKQKYFESTYYKVELGSTKPVLDIGYNVAIKDFLGGDFTYHKLTFNLKQNLPSKLGITKYQVQAGKIFGDVPYPLMFLPVTNQSFYYNKNSYNLMNGFEYGADQYFAVWMDHHFDGKILNKIPGINYLQLRSIVSIKAMIGETKQSNLNLVQTPNGMSVPENWYIEAGFGIENIGKMARLDFVWRLTQKDKPDVNHFGIKFAITPKL
ncbi:MAG: DUF5686 family protein [Chitinophagales bacterium]